MENNIQIQKRGYLSFCVYTISILFISFFLFNYASAATYYIDSSITDTNVSSATADCTNYNPATFTCSGGSSSAYKTLADVNAKTYGAGDQILFKKGDTFYGSITINQSGTSGNPITFSSYGSGAQPTITGFTDVTSWTNQGGNIWESTNAVSTLNSLNIVLVGGNNTPMGRTPNLDNVYLFQSHDANNSITSSNLNGTPNWTGAEVVIRKRGWAWQVSNVTSQTGGTVSYTDKQFLSNGDPVYIPDVNNSGFFLQNDIRTLDTQNEWYYNPTTKKLNIYSSSQPTGVKVPTLDTLVVMYNESNISFDDIHFTGANKWAIFINTSDYVTVSNSIIDKIGWYGITSYADRYSMIENNTFDDCNHVAINSGGGSTERPSNYFTAIDNTITDTYMIQGIGASVYPLGAITVSSNNPLIRYNNIDYSGYNGIIVSSPSILYGTVKNNFINHSMQKLSDGGGIYTAGTHTNLIIEENIVLNSLGYPLGAPSNYIGARGIYLDSTSRNIIVRNNTVSGNDRGMSMSSFNVNNTLDNNTAFDNDRNLIVYNFSSVLEGGGYGITNSNTVTNNKFVTKNSTDITVQFQSYFAGDMETFFSTLDNNIYARPINDTDTIWYYQPNIVGPKNSQPLSQWQTFSGKDLNSKKSPVAVTSESDIFFEYNATQSNKTVSLPWPSVDMDGVKHTGSVTIAPYSSLVYLKDPSPAAGDTTAPSITSFSIPTTSSTLSVSISSFTADDDTAVTGYKLTETSTAPLAGDSGWTDTAPAAYTFSSAGSKTLYSWAKDAAGNISTYVSDTVTVTLPARSTPTIFYVSNTGSDSNNGTSTSTPWQTIFKVNASTFIPGDFIKFKKGDIFYGSITINQSGTVGNPITFSSYGTGAQPIITGFNDVTAWTNKGNNIWESTNAVSTLSTLNMVTMNGNNTAMGRTPNTGYYYYQSHSGNTSITSNNLTGTPNWTGAELAFNNTTYSTLRVPIIGQSGGTLTYTQDPVDLSMQKDGLKFIIQNDIRTLDTQNEWYYNPTTKKLSVYSTSQPTNIKVSSSDIIINSTAKNYITFNDIKLTGSNSATFYLSNTKNFTIRNCSINYSGNAAVYGIYNTTSNNFTIENCLIDNSNGGGIGITSDFPNAIIRSNTITNTGLIFGANSSPIGTGNASGIFYGISAKGANSIIENNIIENVGYVGIRFGGNNTIVQNNYISNFCLNLNDGGGIYTHNGSNIVQSGMKVLNNIVMNSIDGVGIYLDDYVNHVEVSGNTSANNKYGIYLHNTQHINITNNTSYNSDSYGILFVNDIISYPMTGVIIQNNIFVAKTTSQIVMHLDPIEVYLNQISMDNNIYARPILDTNTIKSFQRTPTWNNYQHTLSQWQTFSDKDLNSKKSPVAITSESDIFFDYATSSSKTVSLPWPAVDMDGVKKPAGNITIAPYSSVIYLKDTTPVTPDTTKPTITSFTIPTTSTTLNISGITFSASDTVGVTGYLLSESSTSPSPSSGSWSTTPQTTYTFPSAGSKTLYAFAKDLAGNVSTASSDSVTVTVSSGGGGGGGGGSSSSSSTSTVIASVSQTTPNLNLITTSSSYIFTTKMTLGTKNLDVKELQKILIENGYLVGTADGSFGPKTLVAVKKFQASNNLVADGIVGQKGREILNQIKSTSVNNIPEIPAATPPALVAPNTTLVQITKTVRFRSPLNDINEVKKLQQILINKGYLVGVSDGVFGKQTLAAIISFQKANGITADGVAGMITRIELNKN